MFQLSTDVKEPDWCELKQQNVNIFSSQPEINQPLKLVSVPRHGAYMCAQAPTKANNMFRLVSVLGNVPGHQVWTGPTCKAGERGGEGNAELISHLVSQMVTMTSYKLPQ